MTADGADKAHDKKVDQTADGERLVAHSTFTPGDRELREVQDTLEAERVTAYREGGYIAAPGVGDYHATRRNAKHANAAFSTLGGGTVDDPSAAVVDSVREAGKVAHQEAAQARRGAEKGRGAGPVNRQSRSEVMQGGTGGLVQGTGEGSGKSSSSTGTDTTDQGMDATVGSAPANLDPGTENTPQDRPDSQAKSAGGTKNTTGGGRTPAASSKPPAKSGNRGD